MLRCTLGGAEATGGGREPSTLELEQPSPARQPVADAGQAQCVPRGDCALPGGGVNWRGCLPKAIGSGLAVGFLTGLFGVGGGFLIIPALVLLLGLPMTVAVGTSLLVIVINSVAGFAAHAGDAHLDYGITTAFTLAAVLGSLVAARLSHRLDADRLRRAFAYLVFAVAAFVVTQAMLNPSALGT